MAEFTYLRFCRGQRDNQNSIQNQDQSNKLTYVPFELLKFRVGTMTTRVISSMNRWILDYCCATKIDSVRGRCASYGDKKRRLQYVKEFARLKYISLGSRLLASLSGNTISLPDNTQCFCTQYLRIQFLDAFDATYRHTSMAFNNKKHVKFMLMADKRNGRRVSY